MMCDSTTSHIFTYKQCNHSLQVFAFYFICCWITLTQQHIKFSLTSSVTIPFRCLFLFHFPVGSPQLSLSCIAFNATACFQSSFLDNPTYTSFLKNFFITCQAYMCVSMSWITTKASSNLTPLTMWNGKQHFPWLTMLPFCPPLT